MLKKNRPLGILLISDVVGLLTIGAGIVEGSWDARIAIVFFAGGLFIVQIPILLWGLFTSLKFRKALMVFFYLVHGLWSWLLWYVLNWYDISRLLGLRSS